MSVELRAAAKERDAYVARVHQSKGLAAMEERRKRREQKGQVRQKE